jgi:hypothetical protein
MVTDGKPNPEQELEPDLLNVGYTGIDGDPAVEDVRTREQLALSPDHESYDVTCLMSSWHGENPDAKAVRDTCYSIVDQLNQSLISDPTLSGLVMRARMTTDALAQDQTPKGAVATVRFVVHIDAITR